MKVNLHTELQGHFTLVVNSPRGRRVYEAPNLVLTAGIDRIMSNTGSGGALSWAQIGTGTAAPALTDTALQARVAGTSTVQASPSHTYTAGPPDYIEMTTTLRFALGALNSSVSGNFAEVGIGWASTGSLLSRALITDSGGSPTTIAVLSDEQLDIIYRLRIYPIQSDVTGNITLDSVNHTYILRPAYVSDMNRWATYMFFATPTGGGSALASTSSGSAISPNIQPQAFSGGIAARTSGPTGGVGSITSSYVNAPQGTYTNGSAARVRRFVFDLNDANGSIKTLYLPITILNMSSAACVHQLEFTPNITKTSSKRLTLDLTFTFANRP